MMLATETPWEAPSKLARLAETSLPLDVLIRHLVCRCTKVCSRCHKARGGERLRAETARKLAASYPARLKAAQEMEKERKTPKDTRITVSHAEDATENGRQWQYISRNPKCLLVPPKREEKRKDTRVTVSNAEDRKESHRQWQYIRRNPECLLVPPKPGASAHSKRQKVESKGTK